MDIDQKWKRINMKKHKMSYMEFENLKKLYLNYAPVYLLGDRDSEEELFNNILEWFSQ